MIDRPVTRRPLPRADESWERGMTVGGNLAARHDLLAFLKRSLSATCWEPKAR